MTNIKISLIIPCYNEEANIQKGVLDKIGNFTKDDNRFIEVLIVDDGSSDNTRKIIKNKYLNQFPKFKLIKNPHQGKAFAVISGIKTARGSYVMFSDIDLATPIEEAEKLITEIKKGNDIVIGSRTTERKGAPLTRKLMALGFIFVRNALIGLQSIKDTQCGFKIFEKKAALTIIDKFKVFHTAKETKGSSVTAGFDLEFLFLALKLGYKIKEIPVLWRHVETKNVAFFKDSLETMKDILRIKYFDLAGGYQ